MFLLSPLAIGLAAGGRLTLSSAFLVLALMAAFLLRQPIIIAVKAYSGRRSRSDLPAARFWMVTYSLVGLAALTGLILKGYAFLTYLVIPGLPVFIWHLALVSRRQERRKPGIEILGSGVLALSAPAALWVGTGSTDPLGWLLFLLTWMQSAASIVYAYLRLEQRELTSIPPPAHKWRMARRALLYTSFNLGVTLTLSLAGVVPGLLYIPYAIQWLETLFGTTHPAMGYKATRIGLRQLAVSTIFTITFMIIWATTG